MQISVIGCGSVALVTGGCLAEAGHQVICTHNDSARMATLEAGRLPIYEPHLDSILAASRRTGHLRFTGDSAEAVSAGEAVFICVGTPPKENGEAGLSAIDNVARLIAAEARSPKLAIE